ncbi:MAG: hypothetical protein M0001_06430 [Treponema sp.]|nr:hypothetical protein [Treponema sp.]
MKVVEIRSLARKETGLFYRREFSGTAVLETRGQSGEYPLSFVIESRPIGAPDISVYLEADPAWPLVPVVTSIKHLVREMDRDGKLP